jgi:plastocyanin
MTRTGSARQTFNIIDFPARRKPLRQEATLPDQLRSYAPWLAALALATAPALGAQTTHEIRLEHDATTYEYRFNPASVTARAGDVLVFKVTGGGDHGIAFEDAMSPGARAALSAAMPRRVAELSGPLIGPRAEYRITLPTLPAGVYRFYCLPHRAYDEVGTLTIK